MDKKDKKVIILGSARSGLSSDLVHLARVAARGGVDVLPPIQSPVRELSPSVKTAAVANALAEGQNVKVKNSCITGHDHGRPCTCDNMGKSKSFTEMLREAAEEEAQFARCMFDREPAKRHGPNGDKTAKRGRPSPLLERMVQKVSNPRVKFVEMLAQRDFHDPEVKKGFSLEEIGIIRTVERWEQNELFSHWSFSPFPLRDDAFRMYANFNGNIKQVQVGILFGLTKDESQLLTYYFNEKIK